MQKFGLDEKVIESYKNHKKAYLKLKEFIDTDNGSEKDRAAIIHAYEYTFELWWKSLQKYLQYSEMVTEFGPRDTIRTSFQYGIIEEGQDYMDLLRDRNLIAHTYKENIAIEIYERIINKHINTLSKFIEKFDNKII